MDGKSMSPEELIASLPCLNGSDRLERLLEVVNSLYGRRPAEAFAFAEEGEKLARELGNPARHSQFLNRMGISKHYQGEFDDAVKYYKASAAIAKEFGQLPDVAMNKNNIATILTMRGELAAALDILNEIREVYIELDEKARIASTYNNMANIYLKLSAYDKCLDHHLKALKIREEIDEKEGILSSCANIGSYLKEDNPKKALKYLNRALDMIDETGAYRFRGFVFTQLGITKYLAGDMQESVTDIEKGIEVMNETGNLYDQVMAYDYLSVISKQREDYDLAMKYVQRSLEIARKENMNDYVVRELCNVAKILMMIDDDDDRVQEYIDEAYALAQKIDSKKGILQCHEIQALIHENRGEYQKAYETHKLFMELQAELKTLELNQRARDLEVIYSVEKKEQEAEFVRQKNDELAMINNDLRKTNLALQDAQEDLRESERKVTALAMAITANHQINQPLMVAQGSTELLKMSIENPTPKQKDHFDKILGSIASIQQLLEKYCKLENIDFEEYVNDTTMVTID